MEREPILRNHLKTARAKLNISQEYLAFEIGVDRVTVGNIERGDTTPSVLTALLMAQVLCTSVHDIFEINK